MGLFRDDVEKLIKEFRKEAGYVHRLGESPEGWEQEIGSELHKRLPFLSDYEVNVTIEKSDPGRGFAFGYADVTNATERPEVEHEEAGIPHIRIPIVAEERQVRPFSVFLDGESVLPLSEDRMREVLFNPTTFDLSTSVPRDPSLVEPLMPPQRSGIGLGGEYKMAMALSSPAPAEPGDYWLEKFKGTPLFDKAVSLRKKELLIDSEETLERAFKQEENNLKMNARDAVNLERRALELALSEHRGSEKTAFKHMSKEQWEAIYKSDQIQKVIAKVGTHKHPEVTNAVYDLAAKTYGFVPRVYPTTPNQIVEQAEKESEKLQKKNDKKEGAASMQPHKSPAANMPKHASLLTAIAPTIRQSDRDRFVEKVASDPLIRAGFRASGIAQKLVEVMDTKVASADERFMEVVSRIEPTVTTLQKLPGGDFLVKSANVNNFANSPQAKGEVVPHAEVADAIGAESAQAIQPGQIVTVVSNPVKIDGDDANVTTESTTSFGEYAITDDAGNQRTGINFPKMMNWDKDLSESNSSIFVSDGEYSLSPTIGERLGDAKKLTPDIPKGEGVFASNDGKATAPIHIEFGTNGSDGVPKFVGTDGFGNKVNISIVPNLKQPAVLGEGEYAIPQSWNFMKLKNVFKSSAEHGAETKTRKANKEKTSAVLFYNGAFNIKGGCGLDKVASEMKQDLDAVGAEFILGLLGVDGSTAKQKVAEARKKGSVKLAGLKTVKLLADRYQESVKTASSLIAKLPNIRVDLIKEAAAIQDEGTVDKVLALNFVNPENLDVFVEYLPQLEECSEKMAEMVLAGYLGMKEIPVGAVERTMKSMEEVIQNLKALSSTGE